MISTTIVSPKRKYVNADTMIVTVDIGSRTHYGYIRWGKIEVKSFSFENTRAGLNKFNKVIEAFKSKWGLKEVIMGFESTGSYGRPLVYFFSGKPVELVQVNPLHTSRLKSVNDNSPLKSDTKDPRVIADLIQMGHTLTVVTPEGDSGELRGFTLARERALKSRTVKSNQLTQLLVTYYPEFPGLFSKITGKTVLYILERYPLPGDIVACDLGKLTLELKKISRGKVNGDKVKKIYNFACNSIGIKGAPVSAAFEIRHLVREIKKLSEYIGELEEQMAIYLKKIDYADRLLEIKGVATVTLAAIIGEVGDFRNFRFIREIVKFAGLNLCEHSSGLHIGRRRISKFGRAILRKMLYYGALQVIRYDNALGNYYKRKVSEGMMKSKALIAVGKKLLKTMFSMVRNNTRYDCNHKIKDEKKVA